LQIIELENELDAEHRRHLETTNAAKRNDKRFHSLLAEIEEEKKNALRLQELVDSLNDKNKALKTQAEESEEIAALNLSKFRKAQHDLEEAQSALNEAEHNIGKLRAEKRASESVERGPSSFGRHASVSRNFRAGSTFGN
jgi:chromosome segregation ATPase